MPRIGIRGSWSPGERILDGTGTLIDTGTNGIYSGRPPGSEIAAGPGG